MSKQMNRLVYSPKAYAFVQTDRSKDRGRNPNGYLDISDYIVSGSVNRVVNAVSTAELTLRNPGKKWTTPGYPEFLPMDKITVWLSRYRNRPIQVFTGFLDGTPYFNLLPNTVTLRASCTLKRLLHSYWDPALPNTLKFLEKYGWSLGPNNGQIFSPGELKLIKDTANQASLTDGSMGALLYAVLTEKMLGNWGGDQVFIENLPPGIIESVKTLYKMFEKDNHTLSKELEGFLHDIIGTASQGSGGTGASPGSGPFARTGTIKGEDKIVPKMVEIADKWKVPAEFVIATSLIETELGQNMNDGDQYHGWFQININGSRYVKSGPYSKDDLYDLGWATNAFCETAVRDAKQNPSLRQDLLQWAMTTQGVNSSNNPRFPNEWANKITQAKALISKYGKGPTSPIGAGTISGSPGGGGLPAGAASVVDQVVPGDKAKKPATDPNKERDKLLDSSRLRGRFGSGKAALDGAGTGQLPIALLAQTFGLDVSAGRIHHNPGTLHERGLAGDYAIAGVSNPEKGKDGFFKVMQKLVPICDEIIYYNTAYFGGTKVAYTKGDHNDHVHVGLYAKYRDAPEQVADAIVKALNGESLGDLGPGGSGGGSGGSGGSGSTDVLSNSLASAFAVNLAWPTMEDMVEAELLTGQKSLMNDKQLMPFVQQLCSASLRQFQSLPNGDFFGFFPDYFGTWSHRKPYWRVDEVEILDGKIELTDDNLATHVYVVGDTQGFMDGVNFIDKLLGGGVVTIFNAFESKFVLDGKQTDSPLMGGTDALKFLQKYGARPYYEEAPFIRSPYFEAFLAFQKFQLMWSRTFLTTFEFTFMPELYPGGIVELGDYGVQCYIDSVTHNFDYTGGFTTTAALSAPASTGDSESLSISRGMVRGDIENQLLP